jgi:CheY-like chemotaxis protein
MLLGNPTRLQTAVLNLAMNACDAMADGGELLLRTDVVVIDGRDTQAHSRVAKPGSYLRISVTDTGKGMAPPTVKSLLNLFYSPELLGGGIGMGLANVFGCIRDHNGCIEITSQADRGTTFDIFLPFLEDADQERLPEAAAEEAVRGTGSILIVDDEAGLTGATEKMLRDLGYTVVTCRDGLEAVEYYRLHHGELDLVILDMVLPKLGGRDCFTKLKEINSFVKAILFTGYNLNEEADAMINAGVRGFIHKPFDRSHLSQVVARVIQM